MKIRPTEADELIPILRPETQLERDLIATPAFQYGLLWENPGSGTRKESWDCTSVKYLKI
jgi:hypothetical protein